MPWFSSCCEGADEYLCQVCGQPKCSKCKPSTWLKISATREGNVCPTCKQRYFTNSQVSNTVTKKGK